MKYSAKFLSLSLALMLSSCAHAADLTPEHQQYLTWLDGLKKEMLAKGISEKTIAKVYEKDYYHPSHEVIKIDRKQVEFALTSTAYINRVVNQKRVEQAQKHYAELLPVLKPISEKYGVPPHYIIAFWGVETNFGSSFGGYSTIEVLTTLSYDKRRPTFFKNELYQALKIIDTWNIDASKMQGSWAGAMGHFQFMPSTFNAYAIDFNQDGQIDIWYSFEDAAASAANYLSTIGWKAEQPWGMEVSLPWNFKFANSGRSNVKTIAEWQKLGVRTLKNQKIDLAADLKAALILPEGNKGKAYLVLNNFNKIMMWNRSENYALAIGILADYTKSGKKHSPVVENDALRVKTDDVIKIQSFINKLGWGKLDEDGQLGSQTREAIKKVQKEANMPQDGYPDRKLLDKIERYNPEIGFKIPVPTRKLHKKN